MSESEVSVLERNIRALYARREQARADAPLRVRVAAAVTRFSGSMAFVAVHAGVVVFWVLANMGLFPFMPAFDGQFILLATSASVEAIFLSTFVLISQNLAAEEADRRADLDLLVNLLAEHEITHILKLVKALAEKAGIEAAEDPHLDRLATEVEPGEVLDRLDPDAPQ